MPTAVVVLLLVVGLVLIIKGGDAFVDAAVWMAEKTGIPKLIIGATIVSIATTLPEMMVSIFAAGQGKVDMAVGNSVGSATVNLALIMGIALIFMPTPIKRKDYMLKSFLMLGQMLLLVLVSAQGQVGIMPAIILLLVFVVFMYENIQSALSSMKNESAIIFTAAENMPAEKDLNENSEKPQSEKNETAKYIFMFIFGAIGIVLGSKLLVDNGSLLALRLGVPERVIAISVVAIGTSLPELVTTISAISKKQSSLSVGNIIGANIINLGMVIPMSAFVSGGSLPISSQLASVDLPASLLVGCIALVPSLITKKFHRWQGILLVILYLVYITYTTVFLQ